MKPLAMLAALERLEEPNRRGEQSPLQKLLVSAEWNSLKIDYHPPFVDRLWTTWETEESDWAGNVKPASYRVYLHRLHPCKPTEPLFHPHPWPSAIHNLEGRYEMAVGHGPGDTPPPMTMIEVVEGEFRYEMSHPDGWHYVRPIGGPALSVMLTGKPWERERWSPTSPTVLKPLSAEEKIELLDTFKYRFGVA